MTGGSVTLEEIGFIDYLVSGKHPWKNWKDTIVAESDPEKQLAVRKLSSLAGYYIASAHAVAQTGEVLVGSNTGLQVPAFAFTSEHAIWVMGAQKIVPTLEDAIRRVREYSLPMEDKHQKALGNPGSALNKMLITFGEYFPGRLTMILVKEKLGF
jgi:hypothetical protein